MTSLFECIMSYTFVEKGSERRLFTLYIFKLYSIKTLKSLSYGYDFFVFCVSDVL